VIPNHIDRHIGRTVFNSILAVLAGVITVSLLFGLTDELQGDRSDYSFMNALWYVILRQPGQLYEALPFVTFIGTIVGMGILSSRSEITVLRASGVSIFRLFASLSIPVTILMILGQLSSEFVNPLLEARAESFKIEQRYGEESEQQGKRRWYKEGDLFTAIDRVIDDENMLGIWHFEINDQLGLFETRRAHSATASPMENRWVLAEVDETLIEGEVVTVHHHEKWDWDTSTKPTLISTQLLIDPNKLSLSDLKYQITYFAREGLNSKRYQLAFWSKVLQPLSVLGLILIALAMVVGPLREVGMGVRLVAALAVGIVFKYAQDMLAPMSIILNFPAWIAVFVPIVLVWLGGFYFVRRVA